MSPREPFSLKHQDQRHLGQERVCLFSTVIQKSQPRSSRQELAGGTKPNTMEEDCLSSCPPCLAQPPFLQHPARTAQGPSPLWRSEEDVECPLLLLLSISFKTGSLIKPELGWQPSSPRDSLSHLWWHWIAAIHLACNKNCLTNTSN